MDAKLFSNPAINPTGRTLLGGIALGLIIFSVIFDWTLGQSSLFLPLVVSALVTAVIGFWAVPAIQRLKVGQFVREDGPQTHLKKSGTPTMGGVFFIPVAIVVALIGTQFSPEAIAVSALTLGYGAIGWWDDWQKVCYRSNKGLSPQMKLGLQVGMGAMFCLWLAATQPGSITAIALPLGFSIPLGLLFWLFAVFVLVAESNATNLTDGVDGLAAGTCAIALLGLGALIAPTHPHLTVFCASLSGSCLGFLVHNRNPAKVFMGDTGSLALGGALAAVGLLTQNVWALFIISGIFFVETVSVIAQVGYYKATKDANGIGKRLFKMSPFHNHLELTGWSETQIVAAFYIINALLVLMCLSPFGH